MYLGSGGRGVGWDTGEAYNKTNITFGVLFNIKID